MAKKTSSGVKKTTFGSTVRSMAQAEGRSGGIGKAVSAAAKAKKSAGNSKVPTRTRTRKGY